VQEFDSTSQVISQQGGDDTGKGTTQHRIELGSPPQQSVLGFTAAEVVTSFEHNVVSYWAAVNAYPGAASNNGAGRALIRWMFPFHKNRPDATFVMHVDGGRLQLVDFLDIPDLRARIGLEIDVLAKDATELKRFDYFAQLDGHGGSASGATFFPDWEGFDIAPDNYSDQRTTSGHIVGATLDIPEQDISLSLTDILGTRVDFDVVVNLVVDARATYPDGTAAMAVFRDPTQLDSTDLLAGSSSITYSGLTLQAPVPEPSSWAMLAAGMLSLALLASSRRARPRARHRCSGVS